MKIYVTGHEGGRVRDALVNRGVAPILSDITDKKGILDEIHTANPDVVIHAAAMTGVEKCQTDYKSAFVVNVRGTANVAEACKNVGAMIIYLSTCHIFDGKNQTSYRYTEMSRPNPINQYGFTKWEGEEVLPIFGGRYMIIRISKLFDKTMFADYFNYPTPKVLPSFIWRNYTYLPFFVDALLEIAENNIDFGTRKVMNLGVQTPLDVCTFWRMVEVEYGGDGNLITCRKEELPEFLPRPYNGILSMKVAEEYNIKIPNTHKGIEVMLKEM